MNESRCTLSTSKFKHHDGKTKWKLVLGCVIYALFAIGQIIGGLLSNSLAILTDSAHIFSDLLSFMVSLTAVIISARTATDRMSFGWHRFEILGAFFSILFIWLVTGILVYAAVFRIIKGEYEINSTLMLIMALVGFCTNVILALILHPHSHSHSNTHVEKVDGDEVKEPLLSSVASSAINSDALTKNPISKPHSKSKSIILRAAFIHVIGDIIQTVGVLIAAFIIYFKPEWKIVDPLCTFTFSILVLLTTGVIIRDIISVLLERSPSYLSLNEIKNYLSSIPDVVGVHNLRVWCINTHILACSCHLVVNIKDKYEVNATKVVLAAAYDILQSKYHIQEIAVQIEHENMESYGINLENCDS